MFTTRTDRLVLILSFVASMLIVLAIANCQETAKSRR